MFDNTVHLYSYFQSGVIMQKPFFVSLQGVEDLTPAERISVEVRFIKELERSLGGEVAVVEIYRAWT